MRLALAQINSVVGDVDGNAARVVDWLEQAREASADLVLFPELVVTGYPPEDLLLRPGFVRAARRAVDAIAQATHGHHRARRRAAQRGRRALQRLLRARGRRGARRLSQAPSAELRRLRRGALLRLGRRPRAARRRGHDGRPDGLRGHLDRRAAGVRARRCRRAARREHLGLAVPCRQGPRARGHRAPVRTRERLPGRALQRGRRAGRARLRRPLGRRRAGRRGARARGGLRGGAARRRPRRRAGSRSRRGSTSSSRCGSRSSSACTTT